MDLKLVKFHGRFRDLIPAGFVFRKNFARNYRNYIKSKEEYSQFDVVVWQHRGGYVEINDFYSLTYLVLDGILNGFTFDEDYGKKGIFGEPIEIRHVAINKAKNALETFDVFKHDSGGIRTAMEKQGFAPDGPETKAKITEFYDTYRVGYLSDFEIGVIKDMISKGWIRRDK